MDIISICAVCLITAVLARLIRQVSPEIAFVVSAVAVIILLALLTENVVSVFDETGELAERAGIRNGYVTIVIKVLGISYISDLCASSCRDAGESSLASIVDISAKVMITIVCLPIMYTLMEVITKILEN